MLLGLDAVIYKVPDLARAKEWYSETIDLEPYFDAPFYVGFDVGGFELGLVPGESKPAAGPDGAVAHCGVSDLARALARLGEHGASIRSPIQELAMGIQAATVSDPFGNTIGLMENTLLAQPPSTVM